MSVKTCCIVQASALSSPSQPTSQDALATTAESKGKGKAKPNRKARARGRAWRAQHAEEEEQAVLPHTDAQQQMQEAVHQLHVSLHGTVLFAVSA